MFPSAFPDPADLSELVEPTITLAERWLRGPRGQATRTERRAASGLSELVRDPAGLDLAVRFVDRVARPESLDVAAREFANLSARAGGFLDPWDRMLLGAGSLAAPLAPGVVVPLARRRLRQIIGHLVVDADGPTLTRQLREASQEGFRLNLNLLGEAVLGEREAKSRARRIEALIARPDVDYVSIKVSALVSQISPWDIEGTVERVAGRLAGLFRAAAANGAFLNLDMEEYKDLDLTVETFIRVMSDPEFDQVSAGLALQAYLPDSRAALERMLEFAQERDRRGAAPIKVRLVKGANLSMERVDAELHGWAQAPFATKAEVDAHYLTLVDRAICADHGQAFRVGVASHNLYDVALAYLLARGRGVADRVDVEMLRGMAPAQVRAVRDTVGSVILYTPVVDRADFDAAVGYLIRRLEENAQPQNFLYALFAGQLPGQRVRFRAAIDGMATVSTQRRRSSERPMRFTRFANTTDSDPALVEVRAQAQAWVAARPREAASPKLSERAAIDEVVARGRVGGAEWAALPVPTRAAILCRAGDELESRRADLVTAMAAEGGKTVGEADPEVSEAVDFARWYSERSFDLDPTHKGLMTDGARFAPHTLTLVTPPWNFPVAIPAGGVLAALAAGSAVIVKPASAVPRCTEIVVEALHAAGVPEAALQVVRLADRALGRELVAHEGVDGVVLTGSAETAEQFIEWRRGRAGGHGVIGETSGKNAMIVTASADFDLAVTDLVKSAFGHAGQKCSAASLAILVGDVVDSERFRRQLIDAVQSLRVGYPSDLGVGMGPVIAPPEGKLQRALTCLESGEEWWVEPQQLDQSGRLWSPGVRAWVQPESWFHLTECFGPVLGLMSAADLDEAIGLQNQVAYGLTGGLHSLDDREIEHWLDRVHVGNAYVNRHTTGAIVRRQPFGGWKASAVGAGAKAGGWDYLGQLGSWSSSGRPVEGSDPSRPVSQAADDLLGLVPEPAEREWLTSAVRSDARVWGDQLGANADATGLRVESNVLRHRPAPLTVRGLAGARLVEVLRVVLAAMAVGTPVRVSLESALGRDAMAADGAGWTRLTRLLEPLEDDEEWAARMSTAEGVERLRLVGPGAVEMADRLVRPGLVVLAGEVLATGRRELLSVVREQAVSRTCHRHGHLPR